MTHKSISLMELVAVSFPVRTTRKTPGNLIVSVACEWCGFSIVINGTGLLIFLSSLRSAAFLFGVSTLAKLELRLRFESNRRSCVRGTYHNRGRDATRHDKTRHDKTRHDKTNEHQPDLDVLRKH